MNVNQFLFYILYFFILYLPRRPHPGPLPAIRHIEWFVYNWERGKYNPASESGGIGRPGDLNHRLIAVNPTGSNTAKRLNPIAQGCRRRRLHWEL
jgi:hypothetical protein